MRSATICRSLALLLLVLLLAGTIWFGPLVKQIGFRVGFYSSQEWIHAFCLTQTVLLAAASVYGPGRLVVRLPLLCAWALAIGFGLATLNLYTREDRSSLASGAILLCAGVLGPLIVFALHRWRTGACIAFGKRVAHRAAGRSVNQLSLQVLMVVFAAFAVAAIVVRRTIFAPPDPLGSEHDVHVRFVQIWLGLFLCLAAAPILLAVFRPSWMIVFAVAFLIAITWANPWLLGLADPHVFPDRFRTTYLEVADLSLQWHCQAAIAVLIYTLLARLAGFRMVLPNQASDEKSEPSASSNANSSKNYQCTNQGKNMNSRFAFLLLFAATLLMSGCGEGNLASKKPAKTSVAETAAESDALQEKTEARHTARFTHQFPDGGSGGVTSVPVADQPFYGFHGENYSSSTGSEGIFTEVNFQFRLLDHRDGKDIYEIIRTVYRKSEQDGSGTSETVDLPKTFDVEYAGEELTVFDDEFGIAKLVPRTPGGEDSAQAMGTWGTLGPMGPADCPAEAVSLARALNRSRGAWRFKGTLTDGENVSTIDTKFEIVGGSPRRNWSFNAPIRYKDDPWFSATLVLGKPVQSPDEVVYVLAIHHFPESERHIKRLPNTVLDGEWDLESRTMRWFEVKNRQVINEAGSMVMQDNGAIQFELELYGGAGDVLLSGTLTNRLADVKSAQ